MCLCVCLCVCVCVCGGGGGLGGCYVSVTHVHAIFIRYVHTYMYKCMISVCTGIYCVFRY